MSTQMLFEKNASELLKYLEKAGYKNNTIVQYRAGLGRIRKFLNEKNVKIYGTKENDSYIQSILGDNDYSSLSPTQKQRIRYANALLEFSLHGFISYRITFPEVTIKDDFSQVMELFYDYRLSKGLLPKTIQSQKYDLKKFHLYLKSANVKNFESLENHHILDFIKSQAHVSSSQMWHTLSVIRIFLQFLNERNIHDRDLSHLIPKSNYKQQAKLPTTFNEDEIKKMLESVDRGSPKGKRDYAMILLCARLGLRASDVCQLQFSEIDWTKNTIFLTQKKTDNSVELPLLSEVGNAIIDYLKYARPESESTYIFLEMRGYRQDKLKEPTLHSIVKSYLKRAGIKNLDKRKCGPHALRHSLASKLLEAKSPLPIISEVLGHSSSETTKDYLRIDVTALRQCALQVVPVSNRYYQRMEEF